MVGIASQLHDLGFRIVATRGTAAAIKRMGIPVETINKIQDGRHNVVDWIDRGDVDLVINTPTGTAARSDGYEIRRAAVARGVPCITTIAGGMAAARAIAAARVGEPPVRLAAGAARTGSGEDPAGRTRRWHARGRSRRSGGGCAEVCEYRRVGAYDILVCDDPDGPGARPGPVLHAGRGRALGRGRRRAPVPAARVLGHARAPTAGSSSCSRPSGRARRGSASCARATGCGSPARSGSGSRRRATAAARCSSAAASATRAAWRSGRGARRDPGRRRALLGFRDAEHAAGRLAAARRARRDRRRLGRPQGPGHRPAAGRARAGPSRRDLRVRPARDARGRARDLRRARRSPPSSRSSRAWRAATARASAASSRPSDGYVRLCVDGPVLDAPILSAWSTHDVPRPHRPGHQRVRDVRRDRRSPCVR